LGKQLIAMNQTTGQFMANTLNCTAGLIISIVVLRSFDFGKKVALAGILGNWLEVVPFVPPAALVLVIAIGGVFLVIWYFLIALKFHYLGRRKSPVNYDYQ